LDLYSREGPPKLADIDAVFRWISQLPDERVLGDVRGAVEYLTEQPEVRDGSIGLTGFCMGGQYTLMAACSVPAIGAAVSWYGMLRYKETNALKPASPLDLAPQLCCPYLGLFGADDAIIPTADVDELRAILEREGKPFEIEVYDGAGHAFFNDTGGRYDAEAAADAWQSTLAWFRRYLSV
jgi:carboxymethylenebutenolidase